MGFLPVNAFVIKAREPVLVDTGMGIESDAFMKALESIIDPQDLRWVWLTHDDADHTGSIQKVEDQTETFPYSFPEFTFGKIFAPSKGTKAPTT